MNLDDALPWVAAWFVMSLFFGWMAEITEGYRRDYPYWKSVLIIFAVPLIVVLSPAYLCLRFVASLGESIYEMKVKR